MSKTNTKTLANGLAQMPRRQKIEILIAVMSGMFLAALDQTIVGTALPQIISDLNGLNEIGWVVSAYLLAAAVATPITAKLSDIYGRKILFFVNVIIFLIGSLVCGLADSMWMLIAGRAIQGVGGGGLLAGAFTIIGDIFPPRERGKWIGLLGATFGIASVIGPTLGGWLTDNLSWHWVFLVNLPVGLAAMAIAAHALPNIKRDFTGKIDWLGAAGVATTVIPFLLALVWGGNEYAWNSPQIIGLFALSLISLPIFIFIESRASDPILPLRLFKERTFSLGNIIVMLAFLSLFGAVIYIPIFVQSVQGSTATNSGLILLPLMAANVVANIAAGQFVSRTGRYKGVVLLSLLATAAGMFVLSTLDYNSDNMKVIIGMVLVGLGLGPSFSVVPTMIQNAFPNRDLGVVTGAVTFFRTVGGAIGASLLGAVFNRVLQDKVETISVNGIPNQFADKLKDPNFIQNYQAVDGARSALQNLPLPEIVKSGIIQAFDGFVEASKVALTDAIVAVFFVAGLLVLVAFILMVFVPNKELRTTHADEGEAGLPA